MGDAPQGGGHASCGTPLETLRPDDAGEMWNLHVFPDGLKVTTPRLHRDRGENSPAHL